MSFPHYKQLDAMDCGPACLRMIARYYGKHYTADTLRRLTGFSKEGVSLLGISEAAEKLGFRTRGVHMTYEQLTRDARLPCILHWQQNHFVVLPPQSRWTGRRRLQIADPARGILTLKNKDFRQHWLASGEVADAPLGIALLLEPTPRFYQEEGEKENALIWKWVLHYLHSSYWQLARVFIALVITSILQLIFPFLTQSIVDTGINTQNLQFITIVLIAQLMLVFSRTIVDFIRSRILLHVSMVINVSILSDFWIKLTRLPLSYFDRHHAGDILQRIGDNKQIQNFLTGSALNTFFSLINLVVFAIVLATYNIQLLIIFSAGSLLYFLWIRLFLKIRRKINYQTFHLSAKENNATLQLVQGMQEIRLHDAQQLKRWEWEDMQAGIFRLNFKSLTYSQFQQAGALLINQGKDITITFVAATLVLRGQMTLGAMLAVQYIIGQLSSPIEQFIGFVQNAQDARISMERLNDIQRMEDEEKADASYISYLPESTGIRLEKLSFTYPGAGNEPVLDHIDLEIPEGKVTAIVGVSGSGKTTLLKLLLKFHDAYEGEIKIGRSALSDGANFRYLNPSFWRRQCGAVLQDGYIFNDSIARNIAVGDESPDLIKLIECCRISNILAFIESLPNGFYTQLGSEGVGISQGQRQRLLIARAIYKDPRYLFFDEATNALDANNEKAIVENLQSFFRGRTVVIVAHRLSTVKNADKIVVLHKGMITEEGTHRELTALKGRYFELVKNQLELGS
jgi:ATP-binding cassette, subfamily B, bacterial